MGQMIEDVERAVGYGKRVEFYGRSGGLVPSPDDVKQQILSLIAPKKVKGPKGS